MPRVVDAIVRAREPTVVELTLARPCSIVGIVWDPDSETALEGARVAVHSADGQLVSETVTDDEGSYRITGLRSGAYRVALDVPTGFVSAQKTRDVAPLPNETVEVDFEVRPGGVVRGRVVDEHSGEPLAGVEVVLRDHEGRELRRARTTATGEYEFVNLPEDRYHVAIDN